ncbi:MAG: ABC transporter permease, partial [SAR324 cluster bacterium]|nr:ABC transporter permease [SAR324 cluster bacterium]
MGNFLLRRLLLLIPVLWGVATLVFLLLHFIPGDPVDLMLGDSALGTDRETLRDQLGLNDPLIVQYLRYFGDLLQGDWGTSLFSKKPVFEEIMERVP